MPAGKFLRNTAGALTEVFGATTGGAPDADKIPSLDASGKLAVAMMPTGVGPDTNVFTASETLAAGDIVNIHAGGVRKADATVVGQRANGFVLAGFASAAQATVYAEGTLTGLTALTLGSDVFLGTTPGTVTQIAPSAAGNIQQRLGVAVSTTSINFDAGAPITVV